MTDNNPASMLASPPVSALMCDCCGVLALGRDWYAWETDGKPARISRLCFDDRSGLELHENIRLRRQATEAKP